LPELAAYLVAARKKMGNIAMAQPASALNLPDLIKPPHLDEGTKEDEPAPSA
jgi:hypothetical protein